MLACSHASRLDRRCEHRLRPIKCCPTCPRAGNAKKGWAKSCTAKRYRQKPGARHRRNPWDGDRIFRMPGWRAQRKWRSKRVSMRLRWTSRSGPRRERQTIPSYGSCWGTPLGSAGKNQLSIDSYNQGLRLNPYSLDGLSGLAQVYGRAGRVDEAQQHPDANSGGRSQAHRRPGNPGRVTDAVGTVPRRFEYSAHGRKRQNLRPDWNF